MELIEILFYLIVLFVIWMSVAAVVWAVDNFIIARFLGRPIIAKKFWT